VAIQRAFQTVLAHLPQARQFLKKHIGNIIFAFLIVFIVYQRWPSFQANTSLESTKLPNVPLQTLDGQLLMLAQDFPKPLVIVGWSTWCVPCKVEMQRIERSIKNGNISAKHVLGINLGEPLATVLTHVKDEKISFPVAVDSTGAFAEQMKLSITPTLYLVNEENEVTWASSGVGITEIWRIEAHLKNTLSTD
jgi:cytochrome c biogenesis protein CcmG/thiol:disulfide interchange protein DsbE